MMNETVGRLHEKTDAQAIIEDAITLLESAEREGETEDAPEGVRYITISDTLVTHMASRLRMALEENVKVQERLLRFISQQDYFAETKGKGAAV